VPGPPPAGEPAPSDGRLPAAALAELPHHQFGVYVHVPYCVARCGYCDFNTYTADELGPSVGASRESWADGILAELRMAASALDAVPPVSTVFIGGGTPTLLPPGELGRVIDAIATTWGMASDAEVTVEANPETLSRPTLDGLRAGGVTRVSLGMQSAVPHVLATLDRLHTPGRVEAAVADARAAGFDDLSVDLIYGAPGETLLDWDHTLDMALALQPDHVSAYALIVEAGTRLAARIDRGELRAPDDDLMASMYERLDERLAAAGYGWYEISNWARGDRTSKHRCRHNLGYWRGASWWGLGPGAHSHVAGVRWWNVRHPAAWADRLAAGLSPAQAREYLDEPIRCLERIMLEVRTVDGAAVADVAAAVGPSAHPLLERFVDDGLVEAGPVGRGRVVLTRRGRLLADAVTRELT
jgi:putative oxygen-independent coproporphyrinogen III oxidase